MTTRYGCPRTCRRCGADYSVVGNKSDEAHKTGICFKCRSAAAFAARHSHGPSIPMPRLPEAACKGLPTEAWFPEGDDDDSAARAICEGCPVRAACLKWSLDTNERFGIWGGLSRRERVRLQLDREAS